VFGFSRRSSNKTITTEHLEGLHKTIEMQKGQLALALAVLGSLGFDLMDFLS
jgi:hypothetical protein